eukprot:4693196-Pyramimonas_sp.AAC.1
MPGQLRQSRYTLEAPVWPHVPCIMLGSSGSCAYGPAAGRHVRTLRVRLPVSFARALVLSQLSVTTP